MGGRLRGALPRLRGRAVGDLIGFFVLVLETPARRNGKTANGRDQKDRNIAQESLGRAKSLASCVVEKGLRRSHLFIAWPAKTGTSSVGATSDREPRIMVLVEEQLRWSAPKVTTPADRPCLNLSSISEACASLDPRQRNRLVLGPLQR
jgi:hypothetical protein